MRVQGVNALPFPVFSSSKLGELDWNMNSAEEASPAQRASETEGVPRVDTAGTPLTVRMCLRKNVNQKGSWGARNSDQRQP